MPVTKGKFCALGSKAKIGRRRGACTAIGQRPEKGRDLELLYLVEHAPIIRRDIASIEEETLLYWKTVGVS